MMAVLLFLVTTVSVAVLYFAFKAWQINQHWKNKGVPHLKPVLFFGNMLDLVIKKRTQAEIIRDIAKSFPKEPVIGYYHFSSPRLIINDLELVERVLIKDFHHFVDRAPFFSSIKENPLNINLFALTGNTWRAMRSKFAPMFTTGKLRHMFPQVSDIADSLSKNLDKNLKNVDVKNETSRFSMDVIGSCVFGIELGALEPEESEFRKEAQFAFAPSLWNFTRLMILFTIPRVAKIFNLNFSPRRTVKYFTNVVRTALENRKTTKTVRKDFVQMMVTLQEKGYVDVERNDPHDDYLNIESKVYESDTKIELTDDVMVGQSFVFLLAGFEATARTITFMSMELAANPEAQEKARQEVMEVLQESGELTYDSCKSMRYLDGCVKEALRIHIPVGQLQRVCTETYPIPGTSLTIRPGEFAIIPALNVHMNPDIYPEPEKFLPERWTTTGTAKRPPCTLLTFGDGPRMCIGMRFAVMEIKCCMAKLLAKYKIKPNPATKIPVKLNPHSFFNNPVTPILCDFEKLSDSK